MRGIKIKNIKPILAIGIEGNGQISDFNKDVDRLYNYLFQRNFKDKIAGPLIGVFYTEFGGKYIVVIPIKKKIPVKRGIKILTLPKIKCISTMHKGSYKTIDEAFNRLREYLKSKCLKLKFPVREVYINSSGKEENYLTEIQIPLNQDFYPKFILARSGFFFILFSLFDFKHWRKHKKIPKKQGLSQEDFVKKSGVKYTTFTKSEIGVILLKATGFDFSKNRQGN